MKNLIRVFVTSIFYLISNTSNSQFTFNPLTDCPDITVEETSLRDYGGLLKPERTDLSGGVPAPSNSRLNVLILFVQFSNESVESDEWPIGDSAIYMHDLLAENKDTVGDYWNRYDQNTETLSDWFQEVSMGTMHVTGRAYNIILDHTDTYYDSNGIAVMNNEIYQKLEAFGSINWNDYDLWWKYGSGDSLFRYQPNGYIDMIFKIHRTRGNTSNLFDGSGGFAYLKGNVYPLIAGTGDTLLISVLAESPVRNDFKVDKYYMRGLSEWMSFPKLLS